MTDVTYKASELIGAIGYFETQRVFDAEVARLYAIEAAAREFVAIEQTFGMSEMQRWDDAFAALRTALENGGAK